MPVSRLWTNTHSGEMEMLLKPLLPYLLHEQLLEWRSLVGCVGADLITEPCKDGLVGIEDASTQHVVVVIGVVVCSQHSWDRTGRFISAVWMHYVVWSFAVCKWAHTLNPMRIDGLTSLCSIPDIAW